ncbi:hypothetical protein [Leifsonia sp. ALI-44-B]|uniref:hypothetical protein n=1 Tax=Leifsonia sp. ALI-44-B TaxID=1933776 RepID=UPI00117B8856|nr:hypothetical protein [Leifsonia sp. ALI-44-B]
MKRDAYGRVDENSYPLQHRVGPVEPATPWCMNLADDAGVFRVLCFDFDGKESDEQLEQAHDDADALSAALTQLSIAHVVCESSSTGGRHIWLAIAGGATASVVAALARAAKPNFRTLDHGMLHNPRTGAARPPLSPHRDGSASRILRGGLDALLQPTATADDLVALTTTLEKTAPALRAADSAPTGPINDTHRTHRKLSAAGAAHMATIGGGANPSHTAFLCLLAAANAGWQLRDVEHAARTAPGMEHYRTKNTGRGGRRPRSAGEAQARLERQWAKAQQYAAVQRPLPAPRDPADLVELDGIVEAVSAVLRSFQVSPGRWGQTEAAHSQRSILASLAYLSLQTGKRVVAASIRDLGLMAGLGRTTAADALTALTDSGWVERVTRAGSGNAAEYRLLTHFSTGTGTVRSQPLDNPRPPAELFPLRTDLIRELEHLLTDQRHDLFTRAGLGHLAGKTYALLRSHTAVTIASAAHLLGISTRHAATVLSRLRRHQLLVKHPEGWARSKRDLRDAAARTIGVAGALTDRAERYRAERKAWEWWLVEVENMTARPTNRSRRPHVSSRTLQFVDQEPAERRWPPYPRDRDGRGDHKEARRWARTGMLAPDSLWWSSAA